ncbi:unnamed protein product [Caenorhabditis auriculariae]|uniref:PHD-type domain-containing protein n=1 Tax=Caenorhabditis auriculariae TaxID=2777116 RepID=A0A8S1GQ09_9PELO|nr:unnamed protein product [Caenorhabditis auriculariae]
MITEHNYTELMKNCIKWNTRTMSDRKKRLRFPFYDHQTGTAQRESHVVNRNIDQRHSSADSNTVIAYSSERWRKRKDFPPSDAIETKMFLRDNPTLESAINHITNPNSMGSSGSSLQNMISDTSNDSFSFGGSTRGTPKGANSFAPEPRSSTRSSQKGKNDPWMRDEYRDELLLDDDGSPEEGASDEDEWTSKKRSRKSATSKGAGGGGVGGHGGHHGGGGGSKKKASGAARSGGSGAVPTAANPPPSFREPSEGSSADEKRHECHRCGAKYKSLAGLSYHLAYVHEQPSAHPTHKLLSPNIQISDFCDLCLGNAFINKNSKKPEDMVTCHDCGRSGHPSCLSFNNNVTVIINRYGWQCIECKSCTICGTSENDDKLLFCDDCDRGYHLYCLKPALEKAPEDEYSCRLCQVEFGAKASAPAKKT